MQEYWIGSGVIGFDGTVLEAFGQSTTGRFHIYQLQDFILTAKSFGILGPGKGSPIYRLQSDQDRSVARAVVDAVNHARAARGWPPLAAK